MAEVDFKKLIEKYPRKTNIEKKKLDAKGLKEFCDEFKAHFKKKKEEYTREYKQYIKEIAFDRYNSDDINNLSQAEYASAVAGMYHGWVESYARDNHIDLTEDQITQAAWDAYDNHGGGIGHYLEVKESDFK